MSSPSFYTAAGNFNSAAQGSVDPRTGLFNVSLPLLNLRSGGLAGPGLALALRYSPLSSEDEGFGRGFTFNLSRYDLRTSKLSLSTGEEYRISSGGSAVLQQRFRHFIFKKTDDSGATYQVIHRSGLTETLARLDSVAYTTRIEDACGRRLDFSWVWDKTEHRLSAVSERMANKTTTLCRVTYTDTKTSSTTFQVLPDDAESGYDVVFSVENGELRSVTSHADTPALVWAFAYSAYKPQWPRYLTGMTSPTGLKEEVLYAYAGIRAARFPDGIGLPALPRVFGHTLSPGGGQPDVLTRWEWTEENYLGRNLPGNHKEWQPDMDLGLMLALLPGYVYGSTASILGAGKRAISAVTRRYNSFHLQVSESTLRDGKTHTVTTEYHASPGAKPEEQPRQYMLPKRQTESWRDGSHTRQRETLWLFDESGNLLREQLPDGTLTTYSYYPAQGEGDDCPSDPHGFVRWLKCKTVTPPKIRRDEYDRVSMHYWKKLDRLSGEGYAIVGASTKETITYTTLSTVSTLIAREYHDDRNNTLTYGREKRRTTTLTPDDRGTVSYVSTEDYTYEDRLSGLRQSATLTTHDGIKVTRTTLRHPVLGLLFSETDVQGVTVSYTYDRAGRVLSQTSAPGTPYERKSTWTYGIENAGPVTTETDPAGNQVRKRFDGAGREIKRERPDIDSTKKWFEVASRNCDITGEVLNGTARDWLTGTQERQYAVRTGFTYDGWGNLRDSTSSDGVQTTQLIDPVKMTRRVSAKGGSGAESLYTVTHLTEMDKRSGLPLKEYVTSLHIQAERSCEWDGLRQLRVATDENGRSTRYNYDDFGRVRNQTLPDGTLVSRSYADHLTGNQLTSISITETDDAGQATSRVLGTQTFDGLGRLTKRVSGGRTTTYTYREASPVPASVTLPSGNTVTYTYIPELGNAVSSVTADGLTQAFSYDAASGALLSATEGETKNDYTLNASGSLKAESFTRGSIHREASYARTLAGAVSGYKDIAGKQTKYERDSAGRVTAIYDADLVVKLEYDALGRLSGQTVTDAVRDMSLHTMLSYDEAGREISRTISDVGAADRTLTVSQTWSLNSLVTERVTQSGRITVRKESYAYDVRSRLTGYKALGMSLPQDAYGSNIKAQTYQYDALNNLTSVTTTLADDGTDTATYHYGNGADPTQLTSVTHTHEKYPQIVTLKYDAEGRMMQDEAGRALAYDRLGRLLSVSGSNISDGRYGYDALNRLVSQNVTNTDVRQLYYRGGELISEALPEQGTERRRITSGYGCAGVSEGSRLTLTAGDSHGSLLYSRDTAQQEGQQHGWAPYGSGEVTDGLPGFNGERADPVSGTYHLGNGYRAYSPALMRFTCPDSLSPFGAGGINPYAYCAGDPVNFTDPSGHQLAGTFFFSGLMTGLAIGISVAATLLSGGMAIAVAGGLAAAAGATSAMTVVAGSLAVISDASLIAGTLLEYSHPRLSSVLGWTSMATGLASAGISIGQMIRSARAMGRNRVSMDSIDSMEMQPLQSRYWVRTASGLMGGIPDEMIREIGSYLPLEDLKSFRAVSERFTEAITVRDIIRRTSPVQRFSTVLDRYETEMLSEYRKFEPYIGRIIRRDIYRRLHGNDAASKLEADNITQGFNRNMVYDMWPGRARDVGGLVNDIRNSINHRRNLTWQGDILYGLL